MSMLSGVLNGREPIFTGTVRAKYVGEYSQAVKFVPQLWPATGGTLWKVVSVRKGLTQMERTPDKEIGVIWGWVTPPYQPYVDVGPHWDDVLKAKGFRTIDGAFTFDDASFRNLQVWLDQEIEAGRGP